MIRKMFIATVLATSLALSPATVTPAAADNDDVAKFLLGALAVGVVVHAIKKDRERDAARAAAAAAAAEARAAAYRLPARCKFQAHTNHGPRDVLGTRCLRREGVNINNLPTNCAFVINSQRGLRTVFGEYCLRQAGYTLARRRR